MEPLAAQLLDRLRRGEPDPDALARAGDPEPESAAAAFLEAARHPDLGPASGEWAPALLRTARPGFAAHSLTALAETARASGNPLELQSCPTLPLVLGSSNFLARWLLSRPEDLAVLAGSPPEAPPREPPTPDWSAIRRAKYRGLLRVAARDLAGRPFEKGLAELSWLADDCLTAGLERAAADAESPAPALLALGKLGGSELNFSSDVDLLFLYQPPADEDPHERHAVVSRLIRELKREFERPSSDGFAYRVDLDLRPEGRSGVLANSVEAALTYYESFGAEWERQMLIRLRPVAGPAEVAADFGRAITPFVYRRLIDPGVMHHVRDMKARIEDERRRAGRDVELEVKDGPGGIRDVEFLVQSLQLFHGGREPELRTGNVIDALRALERHGLLPSATAAELVDSYLFLRRVEHAIQLAEEQQSARFPRERAARLALARRMGYRDPTADEAFTRLMDRWTAVRSLVRAHFEALVLGEAS